MKGTSPATVSAAALLPFARLLVRAPAEERHAVLERTTPLLAADGLSWDAILDRTRAIRVPQHTTVKMLEASIESGKNPALGLHGAEASEPGDLDLLEYLVRSCGTVGESWEIWRSYLPLVLDADFEITRDGRFTVGVLRFAPDLVVTPALVDYSLAVAILLTVRNAHGARPEDARLHLKQAKPPYAAEYRRLLGREPLFGQAYDGVVFANAHEHAPMRTPDPVLHLVLTRQARAELAQLTRHRSLAGRTREAIAGNLARGAPLRDVARTFGASPATLRRWLEEQGTNYRALVEQTRRDVALKLLERRELRMSEIAVSLGYDHVSTFDRAFKRWYGRSPTRYRKSLAHRAVALMED